MPKDSISSSFNALVSPDSLPVRNSIKVWRGIGICASNKAVTSFCNDSLASINY